MNTGLSAGGLQEQGVQSTTNSISNVGGQKLAYDRQWDHPAHLKQGKEETLPWLKSSAPDHPPPGWKEPHLQPHPFDHPVISSL